MTTSRPVRRSAVGLQHDAAAQIVQHQRLVRFGHAELPRQAGVLDARQRRRAGAAGIAGDQDVVRVRLRHAGGDRADADFGHELDADPRGRVRVLQVVDQLRQILDRIDVVVRRRADQADTRRRVPNPAMFSSTLRPGSSPPSPGLAPCEILICSSSALARYQIVTPKRPDAICLIAERFESPLGSGIEAFRVFAALAGVTLAAERGSSRWPATRAIPPRSSRSSSHRCRSA